MRKFRAATNWLSVLEDKSALVNNRVIHAVDIGSDPSVLVDATAGSNITSAAAAEADLTFQLNKLETTNTIVTRDELYAVSYDVIGEKTNQHVTLLKEYAGRLAAQNIAPAGNATATPVFVTSGSGDSPYKVVGQTGNRNPMVLNDLAKMGNAFDQQNIPREDRYVVLHPQHYWDLVAISNANSYFNANNFVKMADGQLVPRIHGWYILMAQNTPTFNGSTLAKKAIGAVAAAATDSPASVFFYGPRVFKGMKDIEMFYQDASINPQTRVNTIGFRMWFGAFAKKAEAIGAIVSGLA